MGAFQILLTDLGKDGVKSTTLSPDLPNPYLHGNIEAGDRTLSHEVVERIRAPPKEDVQIRIIVLELVCRKQSSSRAIIDAIGSTYDVDPPFLNAFYCYNRNMWDDNQPHSPRSLLPKGMSFIRFHGCFVVQVVARPRPSGRSLKISGFPKMS